MDHIVYIVISQVTPKPWRLDLRSGSSLSKAGLLGGQAKIIAITKMRRYFLHGHYKHNALNANKALYLPIVSTPLISLYILFSLNLARRDIHVSEK